MLQLNLTSFSILWFWQDHLLHNNLLLCMFCSCLSKFCEHLINLVYFLSMKVSQSQQPRDSCELLPSLPSCQWFWWQLLILNYRRSTCMIITTFKNITRKTFSYWLLACEGIMINALSQGRKNILSSSICCHQTYNFISPDIVKDNNLKKERKFLFWWIFSTFT